MTIRFHRLKPSGPDHAGISRRMFLMTTAMAGVTTSAMIASTGRAFAATLDQGESATLLRMVQDIYPHPDLLAVSHYQSIADAVIANAENDAAAAKDLREGLARIDAQSRHLFGSDYIAIPDPDAREGVLRKFQHDGFFQGVRWTAYFAIYNNVDVWPLFGYQGNSVEYGGYIDRGFSDITFVPDGPSLAERMAEVQG
ncbi:hypothetical protein Q4577_15585 [Marinovum sp. 2_MG-2023]|uniref:hypothetical protein n=1 Tax=unclassified Marinovum TaxID=2647166 RepID=UPI0026E15076|nr:MULTISPECIES: hypothetical protein [unclassified Marinovum]MDO6731455.1 hypothetical protein [Marinovum sp. 2_MG-2023]MDO6780815.1 hypothetical protein [Marinovum sp. 1_MG-2023]